MKLFLSCIFSFYLVINIVNCILVTEDLYKNNGIVPDLIPNTPKQILKIEYPNKLTLNLAEELTPTQVKNEPTVTWAAENDEKYTLLMSDPDAGSANGVLHWLVTDIPGHNVKDGKILAEYIGSGPPEGTGRHRYIFNLFKQNGNFNYTENYIPKTSIKGRFNFTIKKFVEKYNLGESVAGNFYFAQYDDYVPILHMQFSEKTKPQPIPEFIEQTTTETYDTTTTKTIHLPTHIKKRLPIIPIRIEEINKDITKVTPEIIQEPTTIPTTLNDMVTIEDGLTGTESTSKHDNIKVIIISNDKTIHKKVEGDENIHKNDEINKEILSTIVPDHEIRVSYLSNDSIIHTKVEKEDNVKLNDNIKTTIIPNHEIKTRFTNDIFNNDKIKNNLETTTTTTIQNENINPTEITKEQTETEESSANPIINKNEIKVTYIGNDSIIHTKIQSIDNIETTTVHEDIIINDNITNTNETNEKQLNENKKLENIMKEEPKKSNEKNQDNNKEGMIDVTTTTNDFNENGRTTLQKYDISTTPMNENIQITTEINIKKEIEKEIKEILNKTKINENPSDLETTTLPVIPLEINSNRFKPDPVNQVLSLFLPTDLIKKCPEGSVQDIDGSCKSTEL